MSLLLGSGSETAELDSAALRRTLYAAFEALRARRRVLALPPDITRLHSRAGELTELAWEYYRDRLTDILPALGTHSAMTESALGRMFGATPRHLFRVHDWRKSIVTLGEVPAGFIEEQSEGKLHYPWPAQVNKLLMEPEFDLILSIGQVVPHEVIGMANYNKNVFVGAGGQEGIHRSHFLGAVYGMERIMGRADNPVRRVLNYASDHFARGLPIVYVLSVVGRNRDGRVVTRGLFIGDDIRCFERAAELSVKVNVEVLDRPIRKAVVFLDPEEFKSTWLGNKAVYRTRMALADGAELIVLAPGVREFGEDPAIDRLIRKHGYRGTAAALSAVREDGELSANLSAAAHLIHGSSEGRFAITYCPGHLRRDEIEGAGFRYADLNEMMARYRPAELVDGYNTVGGEEVFFISNPGLGLWACRGRLPQEQPRP
jgi:nickel-dependent lactate racemase